MYNGEDKIQYGKNLLSGGGKIRMENVVSKKRNMSLTKTSHT